MFNITVFSKLDGKETSTTVVRKSERSVRSFVNEEVKWESTVRVVCPELDIDEQGDFA